ncbi:MAG TPA: C1 family peptidase [Ignavibacteriaceae bacterium]|nr:C1 family peptidase [Ignavibacteriaceae bacterium]
MKHFLQNLLFIILLSSISVSIAQDKGVFVEPKPGFYDEILKGIKEFNEKPKKERKSFKMDFTGMDLPKSINEFTYQWHTETVSQGNTGTCWSYATTSFFESEVYRLHNKKVKLSEMYTAYWEYVEKTKRYIKERGNSEFGEGSEANAVPRIWKDYGIVPFEAYTGMQQGQIYHDHSTMYREMDSYLKNIKVINAWNEEEAVKTIMAIMDHYIGAPPSEFVVEGKKYSPKDYLKNYLKLNLDDYIDILSIKQQPYWKQVVYEVPDNWWFSDIYYNVPLDDFMAIVKSAITNGYTLSIGGDVSEAGYDSWAKCAVVPTFDIPSEYINEDARQFRFSNKTTTDDHGIHLVGYQVKDGLMWFLIKDSGAGSRNNGDIGYYFYHEDYVKLKMMSFMVHKDAVLDLLKKFK